MGLTNTQYNEIMRDYYRQQLKNQQELSERRQEIYHRFPEFHELDRRIASESCACARALLLEGTASQDSRVRMENRLKELTEQKTAILTGAGYPADYLDPKYRCPDCQDTGYVGSQKCRCFLQKAIDLLYMQSNLREVLTEENFSRFSLDYYSSSLRDPLTGQTARQTAQRVLDTCRDFVKNFDSVFQNLFLYGDTGLGKTFLSHCIARELIESTHSVLYFSSFRLFELFAQNAFGRGEEAQPELENHIFQCDLLIIDDLGTELTNSFVTSQLFFVLNERILRRKSTLISTNLSLETFAETYSERIFSRISSSYTMLRLIGDDIRIQKKLRGAKTAASPEKSSN